MSNHIDCQLKVEGTAARLEQIKSSMITTDEFGYGVNLTKICGNKKGIVSNTYCETNTIDDSYVILESAFQDIHLNLLYGETLYQLIGYAKKASTIYWYEEEWYRLSIKEKYFIVNFTAAWVPPIVEVLLASLNYPDLKFRLSYHNISCDDEFGAIEGSNGHFAASDLRNEPLHDYSEPNNKDFLTLLNDSRK